MIFLKKSLVIVSVLLIQSCVNNSGLEKVVEKKNGIVLRKGYMLDGKPHGDYQEFDSLGNLRVDSYYEDGLIQGLHKQYYDNGELSHEIYFSKGKKNGSYKHYHKNGNIWEYHFYDMDSVKYVKIYDLEGEIVYYYSGVKADFFIQSDTLNISARLIHSNVENLRTGTVLFNGISESKDTISTGNLGEDKSVIRIPKSFFDKYDSLNIEVWEVTNGFIEAQHHVPLIYDTFSKEFYSEWSAKGFELPESF